MNTSPVLRFWNLLRQYQREIKQIYGYALFNGLVNLSLPLGIQAIINYLQTGEMTSSWMVLVAFVLIGYAVTGFVQVLQLRIVENIQQDLFARSAFEFAFRIPKINRLQLDKKHAPELINRFFDTLTIQKGLPKILIDFSLASFQIIFGLILLAIYSPYFIILGVSLVLILGLIFQFTGPQGLTTSLKESKHKYETAHWLEEVARVNGSFKINPYSQLHMTKTDSLTYDYLNAREKHFGVLLNQYRLFVGFRVIVAASLLILGSFLVFQQQMNIGQFVAAEIIIILVINSVEKILRAIDSIYDVLTGLEKIGYITDLELDTDDGIAKVEGTKALSVCAEDLEFSYPDSKKKILDELTFKIPPKARVIVKGKTGSGKSTLMQVLGGLHKPQDGELSINNVPFENYHKVNLYKSIGMAFPTNELFEGTIKENITMGRECTDLKISEVINVLGLSNYVAHQAKGINTVIDSGGRRLPRSIIQKLLIARAILGDPKLLLLEDPLQFVIEDEKKRIIDYLMDKEKDWTVIVVADYHYWTTKCTQQIILSKQPAQS